MDRLWPRVWQVACREEEIPNAGDFLEYTIGDQSILVVRSDHEDIKAYFNACPHRGTRLASGVGSFATSQIRCPVPRVALELRRQDRRGGGPPRIPRYDDRRSRLPRRGAGGPVGWVRLREHGPRTASPSTRSSATSLNVSPPTDSTTCASALTGRSSSSATGRPRSMPSTRATTRNLCIPRCCPGSTTRSSPTNSWANTAATTCPKTANAKAARVHASASARRTSTPRRSSPSASMRSLASSLARIRPSSKTSRRTDLHRARQSERSSMS